MEKLKVLKPVIVLLLVFVLFFYRLVVSDQVAFWIVVSLGIVYIVLDLFSWDFIPNEK